MSSFIQSDKFGNIFGSINPNVLHEKIIKEADKKYINETGDGMKGDLNMNDHSIINLRDPSSEQSAINLRCLNSYYQVLNKKINETEKENQKEILKYKNELKSEFKDIQNIKEFVKIHSNKIENIFKDLKPLFNFRLIYESILEKINNNILNNKNEILNTKKIFNLMINELNLKHLYFEKYVEIYNKMNPIWISFWKSFNNKTIKDKINEYSKTNLRIIEKNFLDFKLENFTFTNEFTIVLVADKHDGYENNQIINFGTTDRRNVFGWFNKFRKFVCIDLVNINFEEVKTYNGTEILFLRFKESTLFYHSEIYIKSPSQTKNFIFNINPQNIKIYEIMTFNKYLETEKCLEIENFMKSIHPHILYNVKFN